MRVLWIEQETAGRSGEHIVNQALKSSLRDRGHQVTELPMRPVARVTEVLNLVVRRTPYYRHRFHSRRNIDAIECASPDFDVAVASWEPFDTLALHAPIPIVLLLHNITSCAIRSLFPARGLMNVLAIRAEASERRVYSDPRIRAVATLSMQDHRYVTSISGEVPVFYTPPGMPPTVPLDPGAKLRDELLVVGTYGWYPKRRDVRRFAKEYARLKVRPRVIGADFPRDAASLLNPMAPESVDLRAAIRFGVITDRFTSGYKLKTTYYLANNAIVLSLADVVDDFKSIPDHDIFIRRVHAVRDIPEHIAELQAFNALELRERFEHFKAQCSEVFAWSRAADTFLRALAGHKSGPDRRPIEAARH